VFGFLKVSGVLKTLFAKQADALIVPVPDDPNRRTLIQFADDLRHDPRSFLEQCEAIEVFVDALHDYGFVDNRQGVSSINDPMLSGLFENLLSDMAYYPEVSLQNQSMKYLRTFPDHVLKLHTYELDATPSTIFMGFARHAIASNHANINARPANLAEVQHGGAYADPDLAVAAPA